MSFYIYDIVKKINSDDNELFVVSEISGNHYALRRISTGGTSAWYYDDDLEYIARAKREIFDELDKLEKELTKKYQDLNYIKEYFPNIPYTSWLYLFDKIKYNSSFNRNGEYFILGCDIQSLYPIFNALFNNDINKAIEKLKEAFKPEYIEKYKNNILEFYEELKELK